MAEWISTAAMARATGYSIPSINAHVLDGVIPAHLIRRARHGKYRWIEISTDAIPTLIEYRRNWHTEQVAPRGAQYVADPNGEYLGFELTPDEAQRLMTIRIYHRLYPTAQERNEAMRGDG